MEEFGRCSVCSRTPLVGEEVTVCQRRGGSESFVCDLCLDRPRSRALGERTRRERVRSPVGAASVQRVFPRPVDPRPRAAPAAPPASVG